MSRGPGRLERAVKAAFDAEPHRAFTTEDLCAYVYGNRTRIEKKHRVGVIRAARRVLQREPTWRVTRTSSQGGRLVFFRDSASKSSG